MGFYKEDAIDKYYDTISAEIKLNNWKHPHRLRKAGKLLDLTTQILEITLSNTVLRVYNNEYGLTNDKKAFESTGAHTNLVIALLDRVLFYEYGPHFKKTIDGFTYREIMEAVRRHDLPENVIGDIPDNGERDDATIAKKEQEYLYKFSKLSPKREYQFELQVATILQSMEEKSSTTGRLIYMADKTSAILIALAQDFIGNSPMMHLDNPNASKNDKDNMAICDYKECSKCKASEMWTASFFKTRKMIKYDDTGIFTAIIILATLIVNGKWYKWREKDYEEPPSKRG